MLPEYIVKSVDEIARKLGFVDYTIETETGSNIGDNFNGDLLSVSLIGIRNRGTESLHLICKIPPSNETPLGTDKVFTRELYTYSELLPRFVKFQRDKGLSDANSFLSFPTMYGGEANKETKTYFLIMENLCFQNYKMWPKFENVPLDHQLMVVKELGKLHAISFAMKDQRPDEFEPFKQLDDRISDFCNGDATKPIVLQSIDRTISVLVDPMHKKIMQNFRENYPEELKTWFFNEDAKKFAVVGHSDTWINNFLFKYSSDEDRSAVSVCFLDWQVTRYCSPAFDLLNFIWAAADKTFRDKHYGDLLKAYYESLSATIQKLGSDPTELFTFNNLQSELKNYGRFAMFMGSILIQGRLAGAVDLKSVMCNNYEDNTREQLYKKLVNELFVDLVNYGYI